jgi:hypothetical protein
MAASRRERADRTSTIENVTKLARSYVALTQLRNDAELKRDTISCGWMDYPKARARRHAAKSGEVKMRGWRLWTIEKQSLVLEDDSPLDRFGFHSGTTGKVSACLRTMTNTQCIFAPDAERSKSNRVAIISRFPAVSPAQSDHRGVEHQTCGGLAMMGLGGRDRTQTVRIAEVENAGRAMNAKKLEDDGGYLWRMETWWRLRGATAAFCANEVASLTRDIPEGFGWLIKPFISSIRETLVHAGATERLWKVVPSSLKRE